MGGFTPALDVVDFGDVGHDNPSVVESGSKFVSQAVDDLVVEVSHRDPGSFPEL
jgi:hypothetical protein